MPLTMTDNPYPGVWGSSKPPHLIRFGGVYAKLVEKMLP